ncbi:DUF3846 domain-containing protein [Streptosporangium roseum]|uniref:DUF3846 domain-containing protein n=1 Tax=Streptosporangium roseum TaxID=2001 RepID=UPI00332CACDD
MGKPIIGSIAIVIPADGNLAAVDIPAGASPSLALVHEAIGCDALAVVHLAEGLDMWVDAEEASTGKPCNLVATLLAHRYGRPTSERYYGAALLAGVGPDDGVVNLSPEQTREVRRHLRTIARYHLIVPEPPSLVTPV